MLALGPFELSLNYHFFRIAIEEDQKDNRQVHQSALRILDNKAEPTSLLLYELLKRTHA